MLKNMATRVLTGAVGLLALVSNTAPLADATDNHIESIQVSDRLDPYREVRNLILFNQEINVPKSVESSLSEGFSGVVVSRSETANTNSEGSPRENLQVDGSTYRIDEGRMKDQGQGFLVVAGEDSQTIAQYSGSGFLSLKLFRDTMSAAPNIPTYVSVICDGSSVYSGAYNSTDDAITRLVPYAGQDCRVKVKSDYPSKRWSGSYNAVRVVVEDGQRFSGTPSVHKAKWITRAVSSHDSFHFESLPGMNGILSLKVTACSSSGGTSDPSASYACGNLVQKNVGSSFWVTLKDGAGRTLYSGQHTVSASRHHDMISIPVTSADGSVDVDISYASGSPVLIHGPGSSFVGATNS